MKAALNDRRRNHRSVAANELLARSLTEVVELAGVLSLSARPDHVLMWSHYADSHRGICLRFKSTSTTPYFGRSQRVAYTKERPKFNLILDDPSVQADKALLTKADFWAYEEEWRIVEHDHGPGVHKFPPQLLDGIILGARISDVDKNRYMGLVKNYGSPVELMQAKFSATEFRVEIHSLEI